MALLHALDTGLQVGVSGEELVQRTALLHAGLLFHLLQATERKRHRPRILARLLQEFVPVIIRIALLLLRIGSAHQRLAQIPELRLGQRGRLTALGRHAVPQGRSQQSRPESLLGIPVGNMSHLVADHPQQLFVAHDVHQRGEHADAPVRTSERIDIDHIIHLEIQRNAIRIGQSLGEFCQTEGIGIVGGTHLVVGIHPVDILPHIPRHLFVGQGYRLRRLHRAADGLSHIELSCGRHVASRTCQ